jgi:hypothetical protein
MPMNLLIGLPVTLLCLALQAAVIGGAMNSRWTATPNLQRRTCCRGVPD